MATKEATAMEIGKKLVALCQEGKGLDAVDTLYDEKIVSIEAQGSDEMPARMEGIEAIRGKNRWWYDNHEIHASSAVGPFCGHRDDQFAAVFDMDVTLRATGARSKLVEVALYTVTNGKIVQEEFLYLAD
jgi:SnoaL-like domain